MIFLLCDYHQSLQPRDYEWLLKATQLCKQSDMIWKWGYLSGDLCLPGVPPVADTVRFQLVGGNVL